MARITNQHWKNLKPWEMCGQGKHCDRDCHVWGGCTQGCIVPIIYRELAKREDAEEEKNDQNKTDILSP